MLGIQDYERIFSADVSQGEMTQQVPLFFLNGGEEAVICRVADGAEPSSATLNARGGATVLSLRSHDAGLLANQLRL